MCLEKKMVIRVEKANEDISIGYIYIFKGEKILEWKSTRRN